MCISVSVFVYLLTIDRQYVCNGTRYLCGLIIIRCTFGRNNSRSLHCMTVSNCMLLHDVTIAASAKHQHIAGHVVIVIFILQEILMKLDSTNIVFCEYYKE